MSLTLTRILSAEGGGCGHFGATALSSACRLGSGLPHPAAVTLALLLLLLLLLLRFVCGTNVVMMKSYS